jgi:hypothetical protein
MRWHRLISWNPRHLDWWVAMLFMVGSFLFALGSFPPYSQLMDGRVVGITFVLGSLFFTAGGYSGFLQVINEGDQGGKRLKLWAWSPRTKLWWAAFIQLIGTLFFNANTIDSMSQTFTVEQTNRLVWGPDFIGCIAFLVASHLYWVSQYGKFWHAKPDDPDWWSSLLNYVGSIFFMASALASFTLPTTGETVNITIVNSVTFIGAVCFLVGAYLLLPPASPTKLSERWGPNSHGRKGWSRLRHRTRSAAA